MRAVSGREQLKWVLKKQNVTAWSGIKYEIPVAGIFGFSSPAGTLLEKA
jgi:hypothetical protein